MDHRAPSQRPCDADGSELSFGREVDRPKGITRPGSSIRPMAMRRQNYLGPLTYRPNGPAGLRCPASRSTVRRKEDAKTSERLVAGVEWAQTDNDVRSIVQDNMYTRALRS